MNLRQVRKKIKSISNVKKITKAMQLVSAVKMKKAQQVEIEGRPYRDNLTKIIQKVLPGIDITASPLVCANSSNVLKNLVIIISSNKGLCGAFNVNLFRFLIKSANVEKSDFVAVGKKAAAFIGRSRSVIADYSSNKPLLEVSALFQFVLDKFLNGVYGKVMIIYNKFISTLRFDQTIETLLPFEFSRDLQMNNSQKNSYLVEPLAEEILDSLLKSYIEERIRAAIISSEAVEHSARMIAMKNATDNANDVIYNFTLLGNKLRQEKITSELLDMITAKESVEGES